MNTGKANNIFKKYNTMRYKTAKPSSTQSKRKLNDAPGKRVIV